MALPAWVAWTVQVPGVTRVMVVPSVPPELHSEDVVVVKLTASPD